MEELLRKIEAYKTILKLVKEQDASFPEILIEYPELILPTEPTSDDIEWAKNILKNEGIWIER